MSTWAVILSAYTIKYVPRNTMKAQVLADFITEMTLPLEPLKPPESTIEEWKVWIDGACGVGGSRIEILL